jgi:hypothetical protein
VEATDICNTIVMLSELPITKGDSVLKDVIVDVIKDPRCMLILISVWNKRNPGKMIPNSIRRALKKILENKFSENALLNVKPFEGIYLKDIIKLSRPRPFIVNIELSDVSDAYNNYITLVAPDGLTINKRNLGVSFDTLNLTYKQYYHKDIFKIIIDSNI